MDQLDYKKEFRDAPLEAKVDMIYKVYWNPRKWVKPIEEVGHGGGVAGEVTLQADDD
jgi:hypothetical protein